MEQKQGEAGWRSRCGDNAIIFFVALAVIVASLVLSPAQSGYGTHQQLFMPPCFFRALTDIPCPMCGMTTSFALTAHGQVTAAFDSHILGPPLFGLTIVAGLMGGLGAIFRLPRYLDPAWYVCGSRWAWVVIVAMLVAWPINVIFYLTS